MNKTSVLIIAMSIFPLAHAENSHAEQRLKYDFFSAELTSGTMSGLYAAGKSDNTTALSIGVSHQLAERRVLLISDYSARFYHPDDETIEQYRLRFGAGYHWSIIDKLDLVSHARVGVLRISSDYTVDNETRSVFGADIGLRYLIRPDWEASLFAEANYNHWQDEYVLTLRTDYQLSKRLALGGLVTYRDGEWQNINEVGITMRIHY
ncbi:Ail and OmpX [Vibrio metschnikovii]|nr:Ail and OmpX [Vibrio metschnikovii]EKO3780352.1 Ail and OmpX [Vibrio metschnikovii]EKO3887264.1 Ail and OmpX [Vibrio metschnikovii]EKO3935565.1 Ail and OmpX [Vibrio metschnikovii]